MQLAQLLLVLAVVGVLALVAAEELLDLLAVGGPKFLQGLTLLLIELSLDLRYKIDVS